MGKREVGLIQLYDDASYTNDIRCARGKNWSVHIIFSLVVRMPVEKERRVFLGNYSIGTRLFIFLPSSSF